MGKKISVFRGDDTPYLKRYLLEAVREVLDEELLEKRGPMGQTQSMEPLAADEQDALRADLALDDGKFDASELKALEKLADPDKETAKKVVKWLRTQKGFENATIKKGTSKSVEITNLGADRPKRAGISALAAAPEADLGGVAVADKNVGVETKKPKFKTEIGGILFSWLAGTGAKKDPMCGNPSTCFENNIIYGIKFYGQNEAAANQFYNPDAKTGTVFGGAADGTIQKAGNYIVADKIEAGKSVALAIMESAKTQKLDIITDAGEVSGGKVPVTLSQAYMDAGVVSEEPKTDIKLIGKRDWHCSVKKQGASGESGGQYGSQQANELSAVAKVALERLKNKPVYKELVGKDLNPDKIANMLQAIMQKSVFYRAKTAMLSDVGGASAIKAGTAAGTARKGKEWKPEDKESVREEKKSPEEFDDSAAKEPDYAKELEAGEEIRTKGESWVGALKAAGKLKAYAAADDKGKAKLKAAAEAAYAAAGTEEKAAMRKAAGKERSSARAATVEPGTKTPIDPATEKEFTETEQAFQQKIMSYYMGFDDAIQLDTADMEPLVTAAKESFTGMLETEGEASSLKADILKQIFAHDPPIAKPLIEAQAKFDWSVLKGDNKTEAETYEDEKAGVKKELETDARTKLVAAAQIKMAESIREGLETMKTTTTDSIRKVFQNPEVRLEMLRETITGEGKFEGGRESPAVATSIVTWDDGDPASGTFKSIYTEKDPDGEKYFKEKVGKIRVEIRDRGEGRGGSARWEEYTAQSLRGGTAGAAAETEVAESLLTLKFADADAINESISLEGFMEQMGGQRFLLLERGLAQEGDLLTEGLINEAVWQAAKEFAQKAIAKGADVAQAAKAALKRASAMWSKVLAAAKQALQAAVAAAKQFYAELKKFFSQVVAKLVSGVKSFLSKDPVNGAMDLAGVVPEIDMSGAF